MRLLIMFDLSVETSKQRKAYRNFRKDLINEGFTMIQYSVYVRVCVNRKSAQFLEKKIGAFVPDAGIIQSLMLTEKQYNEMHFLLGKEKKDVRNYSGRTVIL